MHKLCRYLVQKWSYAYLNVWHLYHCAVWNADAVWRWESCPSVRLSDKRVNCDKMEERSVQIFIPYERTFSIVKFSDKKKNGWWGATHDSIWNFRSTGPCWSEITDFEPIFARSASAVTASKKSSNNTNRKSTTHFPMSLRWSSYVAPKPQNGVKNGNLPLTHTTGQHYRAACDNKPNSVITQAPPSAWPWLGPRLPVAKVSPLCRSVDKTLLTLVPKCLGAKVSWVWSVLTPSILSVTTTRRPVPLSVEWFDFTSSLRSFHTFCLFITGVCS